MNEFQRRVGVGERSHIVLRHAGTSRTAPVIREEGRTRGDVAGSTTEHWDGRRDAVATPEPVHVVASRSKRQIVDVVG